MREMETERKINHQATPTRSLQLRRYTAATTDGDG